MRRPLRIPTGGSAVICRLLRVAVLWDRHVVRDRVVDHPSDVKVLVVLLVEVRPLRQGLCV